jgi:hemoglobin
MSNEVTLRETTADDLRVLPHAGGPVRRAAITEAIQAETGINEALIDRLVRAFYARIQSDEVLGPIFNARITDWEPHLQRMIAFWSSVALMSGRYHGQPMQAHLRLPVHADHFDRWLALFESTAKDVCPPAAVTHFMERARRIADSLELGIAGQNGVLLGKDQRYRPLPSAPAAASSNGE